VLPAPKIKIAIGARLHFTAALEYELVINEAWPIDAGQHVLSAAHPHEEVIQIGF
jgi:hypothetical protein